MSSTSENESCHCGSGKQYSECHQQLEQQKGARKPRLIIGALAAIGIIIIIIGMFLNLDTTSSAPPGEAPAGKVWSPEHKHWHDAK